MRISDWSSDVCSSDLRISGRFARLIHPSIPEDNMRYKLITLAAAAIASSATAAVAKERIVDVTTLDVAGVRLGMFPDEARIGLEAAGFKVSDNRSGPRWTAQIAEEAEKYATTQHDNHPAQPSP